MFQNGGHICMLLRQPSCVQIDRCRMYKALYFSVLVNDNLYFNFLCNNADVAGVSISHLDEMWLRGT